jgi:peptidoglycan hydrolase-like amidase
LATGLVNPLVEPANSARSAPPADLLTLCRHDGVDEVVRGSVEAYDRQGYERTLNVLPLQSYLDGVVPAEEPASWGTLGGSSPASQGRPWGFQALEAQAVAARSYAIAYGRSGGWNDYATICDDVDCQLYVGASFENPISNAAVALTAGEVRDESGTGSVVMTRYSASSGGWTAPGSFPAVFDRGDACVSPGAALACNPSHVWQATVNASALDRRLRSLGPIIRVTVTRRNHLGTLGGRALLVRVTGARRSEVLSGDQFAALAGLRSDWFAVASIRN